VYAHGLWGMFGGLLYARAGDEVDLHDYSTSAGGPPSPLAGLLLLGLAGLPLVAAGTVLAVRSSFRSD
jgi:hypothetical protein